MCLPITLPTRQYRRALKDAWEAEPPFPRAVAESRPTQADTRADMPRRFCQFLTAPRTSSRHGPSKYPRPANQDRQRSVLYFRVFRCDSGQIP